MTIFKVKSVWTQEYFYEQLKALTPCSGIVSWAIPEQQSTQAAGGLPGVSRVKNVTPCVVAERVYPLGCKS